MKKLKDLTTKDKEILEKWITNNGACKFDYKNNDVIFGDGGLFVIEKENYKAHKMIGRKKLQNGFTELIFSKKATVPSERYWINLWVEELDEAIDYLKRMKRMLNKLGILTISPKKGQVK